MPTTRASATLLLEEAVRMRLAGWVLSLVALVGCTSAPTLPGEGDATPCAEVIPECDARRLPNEVLRGYERDGVFVTVDEFDTDGLLTFDEALARDQWLGGGTTVTVTLGAADAGRLRWGTGVRLYYAIRWEGGCGFPATGTPEGGGDSCPGLPMTSVIDARTGEWIVAGS